MSTSHDTTSTVLTLKEAFERYREDLCLFRKDGRLGVLPAVIGTVFFERGSKPDVRQGLLACFNRFEELFGEQLRSCARGGKFTRYTASGMKGVQRTILETPPHQKVEVLCSSAPDQDTAAGYQIETLTNTAIPVDYTDPEGWSVKKGTDRFLSYLKFQLPMDAMATSYGLKQYQDFLHFVCRQLPIRGGYGGLSTVLPYSFHRYMPTEWALAERFSGLEIDSYGFTQKDDYDPTSHDVDASGRTTAIHDVLKPGAKVVDWGYIKGVNWITVLSDLFVERLGGEARIRQALARPDIGIERIGSCLLIRAGAFPRLGAPEEGLPEPYVFVNRVLRVLRNPNPEQLHTHIEGVPSADDANTRAWEARFDLPGSLPIPTPPDIVPAPDDDWMKKAYWPHLKGDHP
ncbi:type VI immunity family protein [Dyella japonica]|uniref:DUF3396 domain-containing protein n=1 Tax=Dyella japonica A8 TaxID=1217721 RepID=A0A075K3M9_9GAMM|nr:type VI immunity family protein [Dyella japonica]AIF48809.1 hypothetical protein HY57_16945 [Dyella japonica A8]